ncbi:MAG: 16S rRNA (uracil(1498)-N(3))-methyltransferase [Nitrospirota bacterium]
MNLILLFPDDMVTVERARLSGRRLRHVRTVHRAAAGDALAVGMLGGRIGTGTITRIDDEVLEMDVRLAHDPPAALPLTVILALPRPKVLRRVMYSLAVLGVKRIVLVNAARVEKSYWQSPFLDPDVINQQLVLGLEQARDTMLPEVLLKPLFKPFVQDELPALAKGTLALVAHPGAPGSCPRQIAGPVTLAIGPEGGFIPFEIELLGAAGLDPINIGQRILNVETAIPALISRIFF